MPRQYSMKKKAQTLRARLDVSAKFAILGGLFVVVGVFLVLSGPETEQVLLPAPIVEVTARSVQKERLQITLESYGTVQPRTQSALVAQVGGMIVEINPNFRSGGFFDGGETLLVIDPRDYQIALTSQEAVLADAEQALLIEQARAAQALKDWHRVGNKETAPDLVLRKPQLASARARMKSAQASLERARLDLDRTQIKAPYAGRMLEQQVDLGQVVGNGTVLGTVYATDYVEIRLPLRNSDIAFIDLPEPRRLGEQLQSDLPEVVLHSSLSADKQWYGHIVRTESALDSASRQLYVIAQIDDPYGGSAKHRQPPKIGEYVTAKITGRVVDAAVVLENEFIYQNSFVYVVEDGLLQRRDIEILWQNIEHALVGAGLSPGDVLVLNRPSQLGTGYTVTIRELVDKQNTPIHDGANTKTKVDRP